MFVVVTYDISDEKRLDKISKIMNNYGFRVQKSVFECYLTKEQLKNLKNKINSVINLEEDKVRFYLVCKNDINHLIHIGKSVIYKDEEYYLI